MTEHEPLDRAPLRTLLMGVARLSRRAWSADLEPYGLSPHLARAMSVIAHAGGAGIRAAELAEALRVSPRSATEVVDALDERGLAQRAPDSTDRRAKVISLTAKGIDLHEQIAESRRNRDDALFDGLDDGERRRLAELLRKVLEHNETR